MYASPKLFPTNIDISPSKWRSTPSGYLVLFTRSTPSTLFFSCHTNLIQTENVTNRCNNKPEKYVKFDYPIYHPETYFSFLNY